MTDDGGDVRPAREYRPGEYPVHIAFLAASGFLAWMFVIIWALNGFPRL